MDFGKRIKRIRNEKGFTQEDVANAAGRTAEYICQVERGRFPLTVPVALTMADMFGVSLVYLLGLEDKA